jgi:hypothetical protein
MGGGDQYGSKDAFTIDKSSWEGKNVKKTPLKKNHRTLGDRWLYHEERKMILNENDSRAMAMSRFTVNKKNDTKESHLYFPCFKLPS